MDKALERIHHKYIYRNSAYSSRLSEQIERRITMTIKELYDWAVERGYENFNIYDTSEEQIDVYEGEEFIDFIPHWAID